MNKILSRTLTTILMLLGILIAFAPLVQLSLPIAYRHHTMLHLSHVVPYPAIGLLCLYVSLYIYRGYRATLIVAAILLGIISVFSLERAVAGSLYGLGVLILASIGLAASIALFSVHTIPVNRPRTRRVLLTLSVVTVAGLLYGILGYTLLAPEVLHQRSVSLSTAFAETVSALMLPNELIDTPTRLTRLFLASLNGAGLIMAFALLSALFQPLSLGTLSSDVRKRQRARKIIEASSISSEDYFKLWPQDKGYYFSRSGSSFIAYETSRHYLVVLGDPCGVPEEFSHLIQDFLKHASHNGWGVAVINATSISSGAYTQYGLLALPIGHEATVPIAAFMEVTARNKHFRYVSNKAKSLHLRVEEWNDLSSEHLSVLRKVSNEWLSRGGRREYTFFMGYFSPAYLRASRVFVLYAGEDVIAYVNLIPTFDSHLASIDHLRSRRGMPSVGMHFLLASIIEKLSDEGVRTLNIGFSPLSKIERLQLSRSAKFALTLTKRFGERYYSFKGIEQFKGKFEPQWHERTLLYTGPITNIPKIFSEIERITAYDSVWAPLWSRVSIVLGCIAVIGIIYIITQ